MDNLPRKKKIPWVYKKYPKKKKNNNKANETVFPDSDGDHHHEVPEGTGDGQSDEPVAQSESLKVPPICVDDVEIYVFQLRSTKMVIPLCTNQFGIQDINQRKLQLHKFQLLTRRRVIVAGNSTHVWYCSCNLLRANFIKILPEEVEELYQDEYAECIHIQAMNVLCREMRDEHFQEIYLDVNPGEHAYAKAAAAQEEAIFQPIPHHFATTAVFQEEIGLGIVSVSYPLPKQIATLCCHSCSRQHKYSCRHIQQVEDNLANNPVLEELYMYLDLQMEVPTYLQTVPVSENQEKFPFFKDDNYSTDLSQICSCGYKWDLTHYGSNILVFFKEKFVVEKVYSAKCGSCKAEKTGLMTRLPVLFMTNYGVSLEVLWDFIQKFVTAGLSMFEYYKMWLWDLWVSTGDEDIRAKMQYGKFRYAVLSFVHNLDIDIGEAFCCPLCGKQPNCCV